MNEKWTVNNIDQLDGKTIVVTGGNSGLGYESVKIFASKGAKVILASRSIERGNQAKEAILKEVKKGDIDVMALDLSSLESVEAFSIAYKDKYQKLDILLNNAGIMMTPYGVTKDGLEQQIGVNHFGHFALTARLFDVIKKSPGSRIVNISSIAHKSGEMNFDNLMYDGGKEYNPSKVYSQSKLANLLFTYELDRKVKAHNLDIKVVAAHPGVSATNLVRHMEHKWWFKFIMPLFKLFTQSAYQGSLPGVRASVDPTVEAGTYYGPDKRNEMVGDPIIVESTPASHNKEDAIKLWQLSEEITQFTFEF